MSDISTLDFTSLRRILTSVDLSSIQDTVSNFGEMIFGTGAELLGYLSQGIGPLVSGIQNFFEFVVFIGALLFFINLEESWINWVFSILPLTPKHKAETISAIEEHLSQVFLCSSLLMITHGLATWAYFSLFGMSFAYSAAFLVGITTIFPFFSAWFVFAPALIICYLGGDPWTPYYGIGLYISQWLIGTFIDDQLFEKIPGSQPYITGLSIAFGVSAFGFTGFLLGPMLIVLLRSFHSIFVLNLENKSTHSHRKKKG